MEFALFLPRGLWGAADLRYDLEPPLGYRLVGIPRTTRRRT